MDEKANGLARGGRKVIRMSETGSTNDVAKELAARGAAEGDVVVAGRQTAGRGRRGGTWQSEPGLGLYMSVIVRPKGGPGAAALLPVVAAAAAADAISRVCGEPVLVKWPNDLILDGKKVCGILVETCVSGADGRGGGDSAGDYAVVGMGVNVNHADFPGEIRHKATSLRLACGRAFDVEEVFGAALGAFDRWYAAPRERALAFYRQRCVNLGRDVVVTGDSGIFTGVAADLTDTGALVVQTGDSRRVTVYAGEVSVRGVMGYV